MIENQSLAPNLVALQQKYGPRPLPLFLDIVRRECGGDPARMSAVMAGVRAYQRAQRQPPRGTAPIVAQVGRAALRDFGGAGPPLVFVPSLINPPTILDLTEDHTLLGWMSAQGFRVMLVDWGAPTREERDLDISGHVSELLVPLLKTLGEPPLLAGYCLGGTMAIAAATIMPVHALALIAAPWHFSGFPADARADQAQLWAAAHASVDALGLMPMEVLQSGFWQLDPARTVGKFIGLNVLDPLSPKAQRFVAVEDWANDGPPLTFAAARQAFEDFFARDVTGAGQWRVGGRVIDPLALACPVLDIISRVDRIVPEAAASGVANPIRLNLGHVGMVVGSSARARLWEPLRDWLMRHV